MSDITYTIGAKDEASAPMKKVESSIGRLEKSTKDLGSTSEKSLNRMSIGIGSLVKASGVLFVLDKTIQGIGAAFSFVAGGISDFDNAEAIIAKLTSAMEANGGASQQMIDTNLALSDAIEKRMNVEAEAVQGLMASAANLGVANDKLDDMTLAAIGLSEAMGVSLEDGLKKARLAAEGNFKSFEKLIPSIKNMTTDEEKLAAVMELTNRGLKQKEDRAQSAAGAGERLANQLGTLAETLGSVLSPILALVQDGIAKVAEVLVGKLTPAVEWIKSAIVSLQPVFAAWGSLFDVIVQVAFASFEAISNVVSGFVSSVGGSADTFKTIGQFITDTAVTVGNGVIAAVTMMEVVYNNFGAVVGYAIDSVLLAYETYRADTEHLFVATLPAYISWFADNFFNIIETAYEAVYTVIYNHTTKIIDTMKALWDWIASAGSTDLLGSLGEIAGRSYLDGFQSSITDLPNVAARALTDREKELQSQMGATATKLSDEFNEKFNSRKIDLADKIEKEIGDKIEIELDLKKKLGDASDVNGQLGKGGGGSDSKLSAVEGRLLTRGPGQKKDTLDDVVKILQAVVKKIDEQTGSMSDDHEEHMNKLDDGVTMVMIP